MRTSLPKKWWFWALLVVLILAFFHMGLRIGNYGYCEESSKADTLSCPPACYEGSCYGEEKACCPKGLSLLAG